MQFGGEFNDRVTFQILSVLQELEDKVMTKTSQDFSPFLNLVDTPALDILWSKPRGSDL